VLVLCSDFFFCPALFFVIAAAPAVFQVWLGVFKAMLGEVSVFDELDSGDDFVYIYRVVGRALLVVYLIIVAVMLLNLLIAVLR